MSDQPINDRPSTGPARPEPESDDNGEWITPSTGEAAEASQAEPGSGWHVPGEEPEAAPAVQPGGGARPTTPAPGEWYTPDRPGGDAPTPEDEAEAMAIDGGWHVPEKIQAGDLLTGVDATIYPQPEPAPVDEITDTSPAPVEEGGPSPAEAQPAEDEAVLGTEEERQIYQDAAAVAAAMAEQLEKEHGDQAGEVLGTPDEAAAIAAARAAELSSEAGSGILLGEDEPTPPPHSTSPLAGLVAQFDRVEAEVGDLRRRYRRGEITRDQLQTELRNLMLLDEQGAWWMVGVESDVWYRFENGDWVRAERPRLTPAGPQGTDAMLAEEYASLPDEYASQREPSGPIALDEDNMPLMQTHVPAIDPEATMVGASAVEFDQLPSAQVTMPGAAYQAPTQPYQQQAQPQPVYQAADQAYQPDYEHAFEADQSEMYRHVRERQAKQTRSWAMRLLIAAVVGGLGLVLLFVVGITLFYVSRVGQYDERINALAEIAAQFQTTRIYDRNNNLLSQINDPTGGTRITVPLEEISPFLIHATVSAENERFYEDPGWDAIAVVRAMLQNVEAGGVVSGFSSITQQLARALVLEADRRTEITLSRKIDEVIIAAEIGRRYTKNEILELYLNEIYYGNLAYGAEAAAQTYFDISARDLNLPQAAMLAGLVSAPATFDPVVNRTAAFARMDIVLNLMVQRGCIQFQHEPYLQTGPFCVTEQDVRAAVVQKAQVEAQEYTLPANRIRYPHFVNFVSQQLEEAYGLADIYRTGFNVYTTLDPGLQDIAQAVAAQEVGNLQSRGIGGNNASVVVMDPRDGALLAMVGSVDYNNAAIDGQVNVALTPQQPGSSIKPLVYTAAFQGNPSGQYWYPGTVVWDTPTCWGGYCPSNYDSAFHGPQSVRSALANSYNIPAVKTLDFVTVDRFAQVAEAMGLTFPGVSPQQAGLTGALGGFDVRLYDMVVAFGTLANNGRRVQPYTITRITDNDGNEIPIPAHAEPQQVIQPEHAYLVNHILSDDRARSAAFGAGSILNIPGYTVAVKTGTTNDNRDNWTLGYTPNVVVGVWHGNTDNSPMVGTSGITGAAPIWNRIMTAALSGQPPANFPQPANVGVIEICADSGTIPSQLCLNRRQELYIVSQPPPGPEQDIYQMVQVSSLYNLIANQFCPNFVENKLFLNISDPTAFDWINNTSAGRQWASQRNIPLPALPVPTQACDANIQQPIITLQNPVANGQVQGVVEVRGQVLVYNFQSYQLEYGIGTSPGSFALVDGPYAVQHPNPEFLGRWDVSQLPNGPYTLRLTVNTNDGNVAHLDTVVQVANPIITPTFTPSPTVAIVTLTPTWTPIVIATTPAPIVTTPPPVVVTETPGQPPVDTALPPFDLNGATPVVYGAVATGIINGGQVAAYYRFDGQAGDIVRITADATAGTLDTLLYLWDGAANKLAENDDANNSTNSEIQYMLPAAGPYFIVVTRFDASAGFTDGEFRMTLAKLN